MSEVSDVLEAVKIALDYLAKKGWLFLLEKSDLYLEIL